MWYLWSLYSFPLEIQLSKGSGSLCCHELIVPTLLLELRWDLGRNVAHRIAVQTCASSHDRYYPYTRECWFS